VEGRYLPLEGMEINFRFLEGSSEKSIGKALTNAKGKVSVSIPDDILNTGGDKGVFSFDASFNGSGKYNKATASTSMKPIRLEMLFSQKETNKMIDLKGYELAADNKWVPLESLDIQFYVPRTFSLLKVGQGALSDGLVSLEFPTSIPGNQLGYLTIVAKVEDNEIYGNVEISGTINWGKPLPPENIIKRGLGDTNAPLWMVYTLIVLLSLVWFHYMYIVFNVFRIRHLGK
jgi:hypothetical protein